MIAMKSESGNPGRILAVAFILLVVLMAVGMLYLAWTSPMRRMLSWIEDDGFYYFKIARNIASGKGSTFDGINPTNGYHPLWCFLCILVYKLLPGMYSGVRGIMTLGVVLWTTSMMLMWNCISSRGRIWAFLGGMLYLTQTVRTATYMSGMETGLLVFSLLLLFFLTKKWNLLSADSTLSGDLIFGGLMTLIIFSRLDAVFLMPGVLIVLAVLCRKDGPSHLIRRCACVFALPALTLPIYMLINKHAFGTLMPISGMLKSSFPHIHSQQLVYVQLFRTGMAAGFIALVATVWIIVLTVSGRLQKKAGERDVAILFVLNTYVVLHLLYTLLYTRWGVFSWYTYPYVPVAILDMVVLGSWMLGYGLHPSWKSRLLLAMTACVTVAGLLLSIRYFYKAVTDRLPMSWTDYSYSAALWVRANTHPDAVLAWTDTGVFGYFADRRVVNLDGLVNSLEYQEYIADSRLHDFLEKSGVDYYVSSLRGGPKLEELYRKTGAAYDTISCYLHDREAGRLRLDREHQVYQIEQTASSWAGNTNTTTKRVLRIWRYDSAARH